MTQRRIDVALRVLPEEWSAHVDMAREEIAWTLQTLSANALELTSLWQLQHFHEKLLVEVSSPAFLAKLPMDAMDFEIAQHECHQRVKQSLWTHWLPKSAEVFRLIPPVCINGDSEAYYSCIATLQVCSRTATCAYMLQKHQKEIVCKDFDIAQPRVPTAHKQSL
jgi:dynein heavy chain